MQIEFEGYVQQQPTYSHVGYAAACIDTYVGTTRNPTSGGFIAATLLLIVLAAIAFRRTRRTARLVATSAFAIAAVGAASATLQSLGSHVHHLSPEFYVTIYRMEKLVVATDAWCAEHGRAPTETEWKTMFGEDDRADGWGNPFAYADSQLRDDRPYHITSMGELRGKRDAVVWNIHSHWLGSDARFGTPDDDSMLNQIGRGLDWSQYPHPPAAQRAR